MENMILKFFSNDMIVAIFFDIFDISVVLVAFLSLFMLSESYYRVSKKLHNIIYIFEFVSWSMLIISFFYNYIYYFIYYRFPHLS